MRLISDYDKACAARREAISRNASRRLRGLPALPVPAKPERPTRVQLLGPGGDYIGTWPVGTSEADAREEAVDLGYRVCRAVLVDA